MTEKQEAFFSLQGAQEVLERSGGPDRLERLVMALERAVNEGDPAAFDYSKSIVESVCKTILGDRDIDCGDNPDLPELYRIVVDNIPLVPGTTQEGRGTRASLNRMVRGLQQTVQGLAEIRNLHGESSHGQDAYEDSLDDLQIRLAAQAADTIIRFLYLAHVTYPRDALAGRIHYEHEQNFNDYVDENYQAIEIFERRFQASLILYELDQMVYRDRLTSLGPQIEPSKRQAIEELKREFEEYLDDVIEPFRLPIGNDEYLEYLPSEILLGIDKEGYENEFLKWLNAVAEINIELEPL